MQQQQPGGGGQQFGGGGNQGNQSNYFIPTPSPYQQQQGTPIASSYVHSPGSAIEPSPGGGGGGVYSTMNQQPQQQQQQQMYQYMAPSPAQQSELSRQLGFGSAPPSVGSPMQSGGGGSGFRSQPPSLQSHMLPPTPQPPTPRGGPASVGPIGSVGGAGGGDYGSVASVGGPGSVNPATPRSVGEPQSGYDQQQQSMAPKSVPMATSSSSGFAAALLDQDSNSQMDSPQPHQQQQQQPPTLQQQQQQQQAQQLSMGGGGGATRGGGIPISSTMSSQNLVVDGAGSSTAASAGGRTGSLSSSQLASASASVMLQNLDQYGPLALCSIGKELTQELINRTADMFLLLKALTDPGQQFPKAANPDTVQQLAEREKRLNDQLRQTSIMVNRLTTICARLEQLSTDRLPTDAQERVKELLPFLEPAEKSPSKSTVENGDHEKTPMSLLDEIRQQAEERPEFQSVRAEHEKIKQGLIKKREHLREIMEFLREFCWQISMVLETNASSP